MPQSVVRDVWWRSPASQKVLRDVFADVRALAEETGLMNLVSRRVWKAMGIDGPASRYRSAPATLAA